MMNTPHRIYKVMYPFNARDELELNIMPGHTLVVYKLPDGRWPDETRWMNGREEIRA